MFSFHDTDERRSLQILALDKPFFMFLNINWKHSLCCLYKMWSDKSYFYHVNRFISFKNVETFHLKIKYNTTINTHYCVFKEICPSLLEKTNKQFKSIFTLSLQINLSTPFITHVFEKLIREICSLRKTHKWVILNNQYA